jgi:hypothetical protein
MGEYWIIEGRVSCQDAADVYGCNIGDVEWCFSDGPAGERGFSADYHDILIGLAQHSPAVFHFVPNYKETI